jgi:hypothetical protein
MTNKEIHESLDEMLSNPKTKNFLNHLIGAYHTIENVEKVLINPKDTFKCVLTKQPLKSYQDILDEISDEKLRNDFTANLNNLSNINGVENEITKLISDKKMGIVGKKTTTYMSYSALIEFNNWIENKIASNDKNITWLLNPKKEKNQTNKQTESKSTSTFTLGELESFKKLYNKFKQQ